MSAEVEVADAAPARRVLRGETAVAWTKGKARRNDTTASGDRPGVAKRVTDTWPGRP
jgi:hypothetical protein